MADGFLNFMDMLDGGGAGASGSEFKGGGLLSDVANALFQPAGYRERQRGMAETRPQARPMSMGTQSPVPSAPPQPTQVQPGPGMSGFNAPPMPMQNTPAMPSDPRTPSLPTRIQPGPGMPGFNAPPQPMQNNASGMASGQMPQGVQTPAPLGVDPMLARLEAMLTPEQRQQLEMLPPEQRMGIMQRLMQVQGGM